MIDMGLTTGIKDLWQENLLRDYTLVVEDRECNVHKVVMAAVSKYFKAMLSEPFMESKMDEVEVKGFSSDIISKLLDFIYTGEEGIIANDKLEVLLCAIYLQMPWLAEFCVKKLMESLNILNCLEILSALIEYSFHEDTKEIKSFLQSNLEKVMENFNPEVPSYEAFQVLIEFWRRSEWEKFLCIKNWLGGNYQERIPYVNDLMARVRFCLIGPDELESIKQMDLFSGTLIPWYGLVDQALTYHQLPMNHKVLYKSEQSRVKEEQSPLFFIAHTDMVTFFVLNKEKEWTKCKENIPGLAKYSETFCLEVNNFLIAGTSASKKKQDWHIFDPRTFKWFKMANMEKPKFGFAMVHHNDHLYTVGGRYLPEGPLFETEQYSFQENKWRSAYPIPLSLLRPAACVHKDTSYVSGGLIEVKGVEKLQDSDRLYCLNLESPVPEWERKASCLWGCVYHKMSVVDRGGEKALLIIDLELKLQFYSPSTDQWSTFTNDVIPDLFYHDWLDESTVFVKGNSVFILNLFLPDGDIDDPDDDDYRRVCLIWKIPEQGTGITQVFMDDFAGLTDKYLFRDYFGDMLAIPPQHC